MFKQMCNPESCVGSSPANAARGNSDSSSTWIPISHMGDTAQCGPSQTCGGMNRQMGDESAALYFYQSACLLLCLSNKRIFTDAGNIIICYNFYSPS